MAIIISNYFLLEKEEVRIVKKHPSTIFSQNKKFLFVNGITCQQSDVTAKSSLSFKTADLKL